MKIELFEKEQIVDNFGKVRIFKRATTSNGGSNFLFSFVKQIRDLFTFV